MINTEEVSIPFSVSKSNRDKAKSYFHATLVETIPQNLALLNYWEIIIDVRASFRIEYFIGWFVLSLEKGAS